MVFRPQIGLGVNKHSGGGNTPFIMTVDTTKPGSAADTFILPLNSLAIVDFTVDWGDGNTDDITVWNQAELTHVYSVGGTYTLTITGNRLEGVRFFSSSDPLKVIDVSQWGFFDISTSTNFFGCANMGVSATDSPTFSKLSLDGFFRGCSSLTSFGNHWDTSTINTMEGFLFGCSSYNEDLSFLDTSLVADMNFMLRNMTIFDQDLSSWNIGSLTTAATFMLGSNALSTANYDAILIAWEAQTHQPNVSIHFGDAQYSAGAPATARASLVSDGWTIIDGGQI